MLPIGWQGGKADDFSDGVKMNCGFGRSLAHCRQKMGVDVIIDGCLDVIGIGNLHRAHFPFNRAITSDGIAGYSALILPICKVV